jgi:glycosyltransferase involved in cell wall biosynthesis
MKTDAITPMILTFNEEPNIGRCLDKLRWARRVIVVDSFSTDRTLEICEEFPQVEVARRVFDTAAGQGNHGLSLVESEWVLSMDSDYVLTDALIEELHAIEPPADLAGYQIAFSYAVFGRVLRGTLYPPRTCLYRRQRAHYVDDGHTQRVRIDGLVGRMRARVLHDDRKAISRWVASQDRYARLECEKLLAMASSSGGWPDRLRRMRVVAPFATLVWCLVFKGLALDGWPGWFYTFQRVTAEFILSIRLLEGDLRRSLGGGAK